MPASVKSYRLVFKILQRAYSCLKLVLQTWNNKEAIEPMASFAPGLGLGAP